MYSSYIVHCDRHWLTNLHAGGPKHCLGSLLDYHHQRGNAGLVFTPSTPGMTDWTINVEVCHLVFSNLKLSYLLSSNMQWQPSWPAWCNKGKEEVLVRALRGWIVLRAPWWACQTSWLCKVCGRGIRGCRKSMCRISVVFDKNKNKNLFDWIVSE